MGVSGCGKSTVGKLLADELKLDFLEGDDFHPKANVEKMSNGIPLTDEDRWPWLDVLGEKLAGFGESSVVLSCSALKRCYRDRIRERSRGVVFVFLKVSEEVLQNRLEEREEHYMPSSLLRSQLDTLEVQDDIWVVDAEVPVDVIVDKIVKEFAS